VAMVGIGLGLTVATVLVQASRMCNGEGRCSPHRREEPLQFESSFH